MPQASLGPVEQDYLNGAARVAHAVSAGASKGYELRAGIRRALDLDAEFGDGGGSGVYRIDCNTETHFLFADSGAAYVCYSNEDDPGSSAKIGTDGAASIAPDDLNFGTGNFSIEAWVSAEAKTAAGYHRFLHMFTPGGAQVVAANSFTNSATGYKCSVLADDETPLFDLGGALSSDVWPFDIDAIRHYVFAVTRNGASSRLELYIDKIKVVEAAWDETGNEAKGVNFGGTSARINLVGNWDGSPDHRGLLAAVRLYDRALTNAQVAHRHELGPWELGRDGVVPLMYFHSSEYSSDADPIVVRRGDGTELAALDVDGATLNLQSYPGGDAVTRQHPRNIGNLEPNKQWKATGQWLSFLPSTDGWVTITRLA